MASAEARTHPLTRTVRVAVRPTGGSDQPGDRRPAAGKMARMSSHWQPLLVLVTGAPGAGKTTLAAALADRLGIPHLNRDAINNGLRLTIDRGAPPAIGQRGVVSTFGALEHLLASGVSLVNDGTLFPDMAPSVRRLRDYGEVVNVHCTAKAWRARFVERQVRRGATEADQAHWHALFDEQGDAIVAPIDLGCERIDVCTDDGYRPGIEAIVEGLLGAPPHPRVTGGVGPGPSPVAGASPPALS
jgi:predicted kinase